jgi:hypothetical protein
VNERRNPTLCADTGFFFSSRLLFTVFPEGMTMQRAILGQIGV